MNTKPSGAVPIRHIAAVVVGNALEFYDFVTYSFFSLYIGRAFFRPPRHRAVCYFRWRRSASASSCGPWAASSSAAWATGAAGGRR